MSHAVYSFLIDVPDDAEDLHEIRAIVEDEYQSRFSERMDENNWDSLIDITTSDGRVILIEGGDDLTGHDRMMMNKGAPEYWMRAQEFAAGCVIADLMMYSYVPKGEPGSGVIYPGWLTEASTGTDRADIHDFLRENLQAYLRESYGNLNLDPATHWPSGGYHHDLYRLKKLAKIFEYFINSRWHPFTLVPVTPYDYRCHDLRDRYDFEGMKPAILRVDIHT